MPLTVTTAVNSVALPAVLSCRDLGITITHDLSSSMHITDIVAKAHKRGNAILRCLCRVMLIC